MAHTNQTTTNHTRPTMAIVVRSIGTCVPAVGAGARDMRRRGVAKGRMSDSDDAEVAELRRRERTRLPRLDASLNGDNTMDCSSPASPTS